MCNISFDINYCWYTVAQNRIQTQIMGNYVKLWVTLYLKSLCIMHYKGLLKGIMHYKYS